MGLTDSVINSFTAIVKSMYPKKGADSKASSTIESNKQTDSSPRELIRQEASANLRPPKIDLINRDRTTEFKDLYYQAREEQKSKNPDPQEVKQNFLGWIREMQEKVQTDSKNFVLIGAIVGAGIGGLFKQVNDGFNYVNLEEICPVEIKQDLENYIEEQEKSIQRKIREGYDMGDLAQELITSLPLQVKQFCNDNREKALGLLIGTMLALFVVEVSEMIGIEDDNFTPEVKEEAQASTSPKETPQYKMLTIRKLEKLRGALLELLPPSSTLREDLAGITTSFQECDNPRDVETAKTEFLGEVLIPRFTELNKSNWLGILYGDELEELLQTQDTIDSMQHYSYVNSDNPPPYPVPRLHGYLDDGHLGDRTVVKTAMSQISNLLNRYANNSSPDEKYPISVDELIEGINHHLKADGKALYKYVRDSFADYLSNDRAMEIFTEIKEGKSQYI